MNLTPKREPTMKTLVTSFVLAALALAFFPAPASAEDVQISSDTYAAIAFSPKTGKYGFAWNHSSRYSAERAALANCKADDAKVVTWVNFGWAVLVIGEDNAYGYDVTFGEGATSGDAYKSALKEFRKHSQSKVKTVLIVCSGDVQPKVIKN